VTARKKVPTREPWKPSDYDVADVGALQQCYRGEAMPHQQKRALDYVIDTLCATYDLSFRPGPDGERETAFAEGKRWVGLQIVKLLNANTANLKE
jgi:hypothetical protein